MVKKTGIYAVFLTAFILPVLWFKSAFINGGDFSFPMASVLPVVLNYAHVWTDKWGLGLVNSRAIPQLPFQVFLGLLNILGTDPALCERIVFSLLCGFSALGIYLLVNCLSFGEQKSRVALFSALFYVLNPLNIVYYWHMLDGMIFVYAFLPLSVGLYLRWLLTKKTGFAVLFMICGFLGGYTYSNPLVIPLVWGTIAIFQFLMIMPNSPEPKLRDSAWFFFRAMFIWIAFNAWWLLPLAASMRAEYSGLSTTIGSPWDTLKAFSLKTSFLNIFRLSDLYWAFGQTIGNDPYYTYASVYQTIFFKAISMIFPFVFFAPLAFKKFRTLPVIMLTLLTLVCMFLVKGVYPPGGEVFYRIIFNLPFLSAFRAPIHKLGVLLSVYYAILFGLGISLIYEKLKEKKQVLAKAVTGTILFLTLGIYAFPLWTGEVIQKGGRDYPSFHVRVPEEYFQVQRFLNQEPGLWRFYALPQCPTFNVMYDWENGYVGTDPAFNIFSQPGVYSTVDSFAQLPYSLLQSSVPVDIVPLLRLMNCKYLILHRDVNEKLWDIFTGKFQPVAYLKQRLESQRGISFLRSFGKLDIYALDQDKYLPHVYAVSSAEIIPESVSPEEFFSRKNSGADDSTLIFMSQNPGMDLPEPKPARGSAPTVSFRKINPTRYEVKIDHARAPFWLIFNESFHGQWKLYRSSSPSGTDFSGPEILSKYAGYSVVEFAHWNKIGVDDFRLLIKKPAETRHYRVNGYASGWYLDPRDFGVGESFVLEIYFQDQNYVYIGFLVFLAAVLVWAVRALPKSVNLIRKGKS